MQVCSNWPWRSFLNTGGQCRCNVTTLATLHFVWFGSVLTLCWRRKYFDDCTDYWAKYLLLIVNWHGFGGMIVNATLRWIILLLTSFKPLVINLLGRINLLKNKRFLTHIDGCRKIYVSDSNGLGWALCYQSVTLFFYR